MKIKKNFIDNRNLFHYFSTLFKSKNESVFNDNYIDSQIDTSIQNNQDFLFTIYNWTMEIPTQISSLRQ